MAGELRVIATAGHVDHGKSSLIVRLTGMDPDRLAEEKRRGLTIDLGYAWCRLPSGREIGFVDVPGHERFVRNMLAGVGPVRLVMFVVAADEGWKPQSEEHLQILDVLGVSGGVIAVTKKDLVDEETLAVAEGEVAARLAGTVLEGAPILAVSSRTGEGVDELAIALDEMVEAAPPPTEARTRLFVDRVFTIKGAGTVVTGTLAGGRLRVGDEAELYPTGVRARIRALQTHKTQEEVASPVSRVAANLVGVEREGVERGCVMGEPDLWRPSTRFDADVRPVRGLDAIPAKGAYKVYAGASEADATIRLAEGPDGSAYVRVTAREPLVLDVGDRFVLREAGRRATVGGGTVLQVAPPRGFAQPRHLELLARRRHALEQGPTPQAREALARLTVEEGGAVRIRDLKRLVGGPPDDELVAGTWGVDPGVRDRVASTVTAMLEQYHREHPLGEGAPPHAHRQAAAHPLRAPGPPPPPARPRTDRGDPGSHAGRDTLSGRSADADARGGTAGRRPEGPAGRRGTDGDTSDRGRAALLGDREGPDRSRLCPGRRRPRVQGHRAVARVRRRSARPDPRAPRRHNDQRAPRGPGHQQEVRRAAGRMDGRPAPDPPRRRPAVPARNYSGVTMAVSATSTHAPSGSDDMPTAARACFPGSPRTPTSNSLAPLATFG